MTCKQPCWRFTHRGGRCLCGTNASRAAIGLPPLHEKDGGHAVNDGIAFPIEREEDEPIYAMDGIEPVIWAVILISLFAIVVGIASAIGAFLAH